MKLNSGCVRGHRSNPIFHPISHPRLRSIRFSTVSKGSPTSPSLFPLPRKRDGKKSWLFPWRQSVKRRARWTLYVFNWSASFSLASSSPSIFPRLSIVKNQSKTESISRIARFLSISIPDDFPPFHCGKSNICRNNVSWASDYSYKFFRFIILSLSNSN